MVGSHEFNELNRVAVTNFNADLKERQNRRSLFAQPRKSQNLFPFC